MHWAVYWQHEDEIECIFCKTESEALAHIALLIRQCEDASADAEENLDWDITLLEVRGQVRPQYPDSHLALEEK